MAMKSIDYWRNCFRNTNCDIFEVIDFSIMVAASDCPDEFRLRRDRIAELLFSCRWSGCGGSDRVGSAVSAEDDSDDGRLRGDGEAEALTDDIEALTDEIEEESRAAAEVLRIKELLLNSRDESDSVLYESLKRLQLMELSVGTLKSTGIGKAVNHLRKHGSKQISNLAQTLISVWKAIVDAWFKTAPAAPEPDCTPDSINPSIVDEEEGLPSPPLDEAFFAAQTAPIELSQFFDGMDEDGNPRSSGEFIRNRGNGGPRRPSPLEKNQKPLRPNPNARGGDDAPKLKKNIDTKPNVEPRVDREAKLQPNRTNPDPPIQKRQLGNRQQERKYSEEDTVQMKLEATKRRLQESYQQVEKAKKQRTIQVMDLHDLPKQQSRGNHSNQPGRPGGIQNRRFANGRR